MVVIGGITDITLITMGITITMVIMMGMGMAVQEVIIILIEHMDVFPTVQT
jgi:hypothetical protein